MTQDPATSSRLTPEWRQWIAENKLLGVDDQTLLLVLTANAIPERTAEEAVQDIVRHPVYAAGCQIAQRLHKLESLLEVQRQLSLLSASSQTVERKAGIDPAEFLERYYSVNRPVVLTDLLQDWKARSLWCPEYLRRVCGDELVEVMCGRNADPRYEVNLESHRTQLPFRSYVDMVTGTTGTNDYYLVANNRFMERVGLQSLSQDMVPLPAFLEASLLSGQVFFWFGPAGTITPLHHDTVNILLAQVYGCKRVTLISPSHTHLLYNNLGVYSDVDCENPDERVHPLFGRVRATELVVNPGEVLFLPVGWWHHVRALDISITVSFTNFIYPNQYDWNHPQG